MPARRMTVSSLPLLTSTSTSPESPSPSQSSQEQSCQKMSKADTNGKSDDAYKLKRIRNNNAVRKTREKSKQTALERKKNVDKLRIDNKQLETRIEEVEKNIEKMKEIILHRQPKEYNNFLAAIIREKTSD